MGPLQILQIHQKSFEIHVENFNSVLDKVPNLPVALVCINGSMREGKSFTHSYFIRYLKNQGKPGWFESTLSDHEMFAWRSGLARETVGINIWSEPFITKVEDGKEVAVLLLDCQGLFDSETTYAQNAGIYAFSTLLSSVMIYNVKTKLEEDLLQKILLFSNYTDSVSSTFPDHRNTKPNFMFLIRDFEFLQEFALGFHNRDNFPKGKLANPGNYFDKIFGSNRVMHDKNRAVREAIQKSYKDIGMFLLPHPGRKFLDNPKVNSPSEDFKKSLKDFVEHTMRRLVTKKIDNEEMTGKTLKVHVKLWAALCNDARFPVAKTDAEMTAMFKNEMAYTAALETFKMKCNQILNANGSVEDDYSFLARYEPILEEVIKQYKASWRAGDEYLFSDYVKKLTEVCSTHFHKNCVELNRENRKIKAEKLSKEEEQKKMDVAQQIFTGMEKAVTLINVGANLIGTVLDAVTEIRKMRNFNARQKATQRTRRV